MSLMGKLKESYAKRYESRMRKKTSKIRGKQAELGTVERDFGRYADAKHDYEKGKQRLAEAKKSLADERSITRQKQYTALEAKYGRSFSAGKKIKSAAGEVLGFGGQLAIQGAKSYGQTRSKLSRTRRRPRATVRLRTYPVAAGFESPFGGSGVSLSGTIAHGDWSGGKNVMTTDFFGHPYEKEEKNYLGRAEEKAWNMDIFGQSNQGNVDFYGETKKKKNQKFF